MNILFISMTGDAVGIAHRLATEGNSVRMYIKDKRYQYVAEGLVERVTNWRPSASSWANFVIGDMVGMGNTAGTLDRFDVLHLGFNNFADMLELDRAKQLDLFKKLGITVPRSMAFDSPTNASSILKVWKNPGYAIKPSGNIETGKTYVTKEKEHFEWALEQYSGDQELVVQELVDGVEVSTEGWFNGSEFVEPFNHTFEEKRLMSGDIGPNTGCMGNVVIPARSDSPLVDNVRKMEPWLRKINYRGPVDLNTIVNKQGIWTLEPTMRFGYDAIEALAEAMLPAKLGDVLRRIALGQDVPLPLAQGVVSIAVRISVPPYPHAEPEPDGRGLPVIFNGPDPQALLTHLWPADIYAQKGKWFWAAGDGVLLKVTAAANTLKEAQKLVYERVDRVSVQGAQYRTDIGGRVEANLKVLRTLGAA